jgi:hypothetical protein
VTAGPLAGAGIELAAPAPVATAARCVLAGLGAGTRRPVGRAVLAGAVDPALDAGLAAGPLGRAAALGLVAGGALSVVAGIDVVVDADAVAGLVLLPLLVDPGHPRPPAPLAAPGGGWVHADLGAPGDADAFDRLLATVGGGADARAVEAEAQAWRLPVVAYRRRPRPARPAAAPGPTELRPSAVASAELQSPLAGVVVVDLTAGWAGPLATWLLAALGARVTKVESAVRPDGMRGRPAVFAALDRGKEHVHLDLREPAAHTELVARIAAAQVLVDSFSPRVMPNLGLTPAQLGPAGDRLVAASITAFEPGTPEYGWVAYGTGAHAFCGLGDLGTGEFAAPVLSYPDPLAGLAATAGVLATLAGGGCGPVTASLAGAVAPLAAVDDGGTLLVSSNAAVAGLRSRLADRGWLDDGGFRRPPFVLGGAR